MEGLKVGEAAARAGWSPRMLRYIDRFGLVVPAALRRLPALRAPRAEPAPGARRAPADAYDLEISDLVFAARLRREPVLRKAVDGWLAGADDLAWVEWEQRKHERLLAA